MHPDDPSPEEWALILEHRAARSNLEGLKTVDDWRHLPPIEPPEPAAPPGPAETLAAQALEVFTLELSLHLHHASTGHLDSGNLLRAVMLLCRWNNLPVPLDLPAPPPPAKRRRGRRPDPAKPVADYRQSRAIHVYIRQRLSLERPHHLPYGDALTALLDRQARAIDEAKAGSLDLLTEAVRATQPPHRENTSRPALEYRRYRRSMLIDDLAADFFAELLLRGGFFSSPGKNRSDHHTSKDP